MPSSGRRLSETHSCGLGPAVAAATCAAEAFLYHSGDHPLAGRRASGLSLWHPGADWTLNDDTEPVITYFPSRLWLIGLGNKSNRGLNEALEETGLRHYFLGTRTAEQTASKPSPKMLMELLDEFGLVPGQAWMIGDTDFDLHMAHNAGCIPIAISHGAHNYERLLAAKPAIIIDDLPSLLPLYHDANAKRDEFK